MRKIVTFWTQYHSQHVASRLDFCYAIIQTYKMSMKNLSELFKCYHGVVPEQRLNSLLYVEHTDQVRTCVWKA